MKRFYAYLLIVLLSFIYFLHPTMASGSELLISKVQLSTTTNASDEIVAIFNNSSTDLDISGVKLEYKSATGTSWTIRAEVPASTTLHSFSEYSFASVAPADQKMSAGLAQTGGNIRLLDSGGNLLDALAWGNGDSALGEAVTAPAIGSIILRKAVPNSLSLQDSGSNAADFSIDDSNTTSNPSQSDSTSSDNTNSEANNGIILQISELFPDPVSPQTDSNDEFIELYNPMSESVLLSGWQLADSGGKTFTLPAQTFAPNSYVVFYSKQTHISLNNDGDTISLLSPAGEQVDQSPDYGKSHPGLSWGLTEDGWAWTLSPTPGTSNAAALLFPASSTSTKKPTKTSKASTKKSTTKAKAAKLTATKSTDPGSTEDKAATKQVYQIWAVLLIAAGVGTIGYGIYEYRSEIKAIYLRFRAVTKSRSKSGVSD